MCFINRVRPHNLFISDPDNEQSVIQRLSRKNISRTNILVQILIFNRRKKIIEESTAPTSMQCVTKVAVKLPDFWTKDPDLWFLHAVAAFRNAQVTQSRTKFNHVVQKPPQNIMVFYKYKYIYINNLY